MPDLYAMIAEVDVATQERLAGILELRAADPHQRAIRDAYLAEIASRELATAAAGAPSPD